MRTMVRWSLLTLTVSMAAPLPLTAQTAVRPDTLVFDDPRDRFSVEFPKDWTWTLVLPSGEPIAMFVQPESEAAVIVERFRSKVRLASEDVGDVAAQVEVELLKENQPAASDITSKVVNENRRRLIVIDYTRPGLEEAERVRQYSYLIADSIYRISCFSTRTKFVSYLGVCESVAESFKPAGEFTPGAR